ncbi:MAG: SdrD B-like domain-containing protein [Bacteroidota bacterium]
MSINTDLPNGTKVRVEFFDLPPDGFYSGVGEDNDGVSIQFKSIGDCDVNFGLAQAADFCDETPYVVVPCYAKGDPLAVGSGVADDDALIVVPYDAAGTDAALKKSIASAGEIGSTWGVAYNRFTKTVFTSALLKRHAGWGPDGLGAIYKVDASDIENSTPTGNTNLYVDLKATYGMDTGDENVINRFDEANAPENFLPGAGNAQIIPSWDVSVFDKVGKWSLGDMDISDDADSLFVVNLRERTLVIIKNDPQTNVPQGATKLDIPDPGCTANSDWRPWALKYSKGVIYVGGVCSAQSTQQREDMSATVYKYIPSTNSWETLLSFPLGYPKGSPVDFLGDKAPATCEQWNPWVDDFFDLTIVGNNQEVCYPQPILSDIEIDIFGNFTFAFIDRAGHQVGFYNYSTDYPNDRSTYKGNVGGDVLRAYNNNGTLLIEKNAEVGYSSSAGKNNGEGPCGGEFYYQDAFITAHSETAHGGLALHPSNNEILLNVMDPVRSFSGGLAWYDNFDGKAKRTYEIYRDGDRGAATFAKSAGLGDIELLCSPGDLRVSNLVFNDINKNGIQDANDEFLDGVNVILYQVKDDGSLTKIAEDVTGSSGFKGQYEFTQVDGLLPSTDYVIAFGTDGQFANSVLNLGGPDEFILTLKDVDSGDRSDQRDSDIMVADETFDDLVKGLPVIEFSTQNINNNDPSLDAGFRANCVLNVNPQVVTVCEESNGKATFDLTILSNAIDSDFTVGELITTESDGKLMTFHTQLPNSINSTSGLISDPANYSTGSNIVFVRVAEKNGDICFATAEIELNVVVDDVEIKVIEKVKICLTRPLRLALLKASVTGVEHDRVRWVTPDGDGHFEDADGNILTGTIQFDQARQYVPGANDLKRGSASFYLFAETDICGLKASPLINMMIKQVDCGDFFWKPNKN